MNFIATTSRVPRSDNLFFTINGQSNAVGWETGAPSEAYLLGVIPRVFIWTGASFDPLEYGVNNEGELGHGIELKLGYLASKITTGNIYIVKHARGSSALSPWTPSNDWSPSGDLFGQFVTKFNNATNFLTTNSISYEYVSNFWNQGEQDANEVSLYHKYGDALNNLEIRMRSELNNVPDSMRFIVCRITSKTSFPYLQEVRDFLMNKEYIQADDLTLIGGVVHYDSEGQNVLADRFFNKSFPY